MTPKLSRPRLTRQQVEDLTRAVCDEIHERVQLYDAAGRPANGHQLAHIEPCVEDAIRRFFAREE